MHIYIFPSPDLPQIETSVQGLLTTNGAGFDVIELEKVGRKKGYTCSGQLSALNVSIEHPAEVEGAPAKAVHPALAEVNLLF